MKRFKGTKGKWYASGSSEIVSMPSQCKIAGRVSGWNPEEAKANAQLMASAPELLDVLLDIIDLVDNAPCGYYKDELIVHEGDMDSAKSVVAKALGL